MDLTSWLLFIAVAVAAILSPGPAILLAVSNSIRFGMTKVFISSLGNITGLLILSLVAIFGLGAVLKTSNTLFLIIKIIGAVYLIYMGVRQFLSRDSFFNKIDEKRGRGVLKRNKIFFLEGFLIAITNPKAILFFTALFPQFINTEKALIPQFVLMTFAFMLMSFCTLVSYGFLASKAKNWFAKGNRTRWFNRTLGTVFIVIGASVLQLKLER